MEFEIFFSKPMEIYTILFVLSECIISRKQVENIWNSPEDISEKKSSLENVNLSQILKFKVYLTPFEPV